MGVTLKNIFKNGSPIEVSVRSFIAIITSITLCWGALYGRLEWQDFKEIALVVFTYYFTVKFTEDRMKRERSDGEKENL